MIMLFAIMDGKEIVAKKNFVQVIAMIEEYVEMGHVFVIMDTQEKHAI